MSGLFLHRGTIFEQKDQLWHLAYMRENNLSNDDIDKLEKSIEQDGWFTHPNLPINWRYKKIERSSLLFSDQTGTYFGSREKALKSLKKSQFQF